MSETQIRKFYCQKHPNELVARVYLRDVSKPLLCVECLLGIDNTSSEKNNIKTLKAFVEEIAASEEKGTDFDINRQNYPPELEDILKSEQETIEKLAAHIEKEKQKVDEVYEQVKERVLMILQKKRLELLALLDGQLHTFKQNYKRLKNKINKFFHGENENTFGSKEDIFNKINNFNQTYELENFVSNLLEEYLENKTILSQGRDYIEALKENIGTVAKEIKSQANHFPTSVLTNPSEFERVTKLLQDEISKDLIKVNRIENPLIDIMLSGGVFETEILKGNIKLIDTLKQWIVPEKNVKFKLMWRCSVDGWDWSKFYSQCGTAKPNLILAKVKENGQIIGGYTDQDWQANNKWKASKFSFIFNLSLKKKYKGKQGIIQNAIYCNSSGGPTFGEGYDLYFGPAMNTSTSSYSYLGYTYEGSLDTSICDVTNFMIEEFEFFECEHRKLTGKDEAEYLSNEIAPVNDDDDISENSVDIDGSSENVSEKSVEDSEYIYSEKSVE